MAAIDFPSSPTTGQIFAAGNGVSYQYNGTLWLATGASAGGDFYATSSASTGISSTNAPFVFPTVITGNAGGWYSVSNGRYTPPAGRYFVSAGMCVQPTGAGAIGCSIRKNGSAPAFVSGTTQVLGSAWSQAQSDGIVDANGTDYFDVWVYSTAAISSTDKHWFAAFPTSGIKGPQGDPPTAGGGVVSEINLAAPALTMDFFSLPLRTLDLSFYLVPTAPPANLVLRVANGSTVNLAASYNTQRHYATTAAPGADSQLLQTFYLLSSGVTAGGAFGKIHLPGSALGSFGAQGVAQVFSYNSTLLQLGLSGPGGNGLQLAFSTGNIATGSYCRVIGWP